MFTIFMARACQRCGRGHNVANSRSHSNIATKRVQKLNLQKFRIAGQRRLICASCIKTLNKQAVQ